MYAIGRTAEKIVERQLHLWLCQCPNKLSGWPTQADDSPGFQAAYAQLEGLCQAIVSELQSDLELHDTGVFPQPIQLHQMTSAEYCKVRLYTFVAKHACSIRMFLSPTCQSVTTGPKPLQVMAHHIPVVVETSCACK